MFLAQARIKEQRAQSHYQHRLQTKVIEQSHDHAFICSVTMAIPLPQSMLISYFISATFSKVLLAWRQATSHAVSKHNQQREVVARAQSCIEQGEKVTDATCGI